jgi:hypothetical protein
MGRRPLALPIGIIASTLLATLLVACGPTQQAAAPSPPAAAAVASPTPAPPTATPTARPAPAASPAASPTRAGTPGPATPSILDIGTPVRFKIPAIGVDAVVEEVGLDQENAMDVPREPRNVAWYRYGPRPGQPGSSVIAGHVDYRDIGPVVFWRLHELKQGDEVIVVDDKGAERAFVVTSTEVFPRQQAPVERIFGAAAGPRLNLITCDRESTFNRDRREYQNNIVVFAEPKQ